MAPLPAAARLSARLLQRGFRTSAAARAAQNFTMPALSPTMTQGNIASWKVKEGDSFSAGDVLLEIETDKATMDVEAQDDGIVMKIMHGDGAQSVQVGTRIGVLAEPGDDVNSLELPADEQPAKQPAKEDSAPAAADAAPAQAAAPKQSRPTGQKAAPQKYPLYPSVQHLVKQHQLDDAAIGAITPTGPQGRLLKGDVLAYLGSISAKRPEQIKTRFDHNSHLDLSNIKVAAPKEAPKKPAAKAPEPPKPIEISLPISFSAAVEIQKKVQETLGASIPLSTFVSRAIDVANDHLPLPANYKPSADELFNEVLGLDQISGSRGHYVPQIVALPTASSFTGLAPKPKKDLDIIDFLASGASSKPAAKPAGSRTPIPVADGQTFRVSAPKAEAQRVQAFLERLKVLLEEEPGRLVL